MGLDSVELLLTWEGAFGIQISNAKAEAIQTPRHAIELISHKLNAQNVPNTCPNLRAFHLCRKGLRSASKKPGLLFNLKTPIRVIRGPIRNRVFWQEFKRATQLHDFNPPSFFSLDVRVLRRGHLVREIFDEVRTNHLKHLKKKDEPWTRDWIQFGVRQCTSYSLGVKDFSDDDEFIRDLNMD